MANAQKRKGDKFEALTRDYLAEAVPAERIPAGATLDRGDIWVPGNTIQCKNWVRLALPEWWRDAREQAGNNAHELAWVVHKRHGTTDPAQQWVTCDLAQLRTILQRGMPTT